MTRDNIIWFIVLVGGLATGLLGHFDLLQKAFPGLSPVWEARIELFSFIGSIAGGLLRASPLALSPTSTLAQQPKDPSATLTVTGKVKDGE